MNEMTQTIAADAEQSAGRAEELLIQSEEIITMVGVFRSNHRLETAKIETPISALLKTGLPSAESQAMQITG